MIAEMKKQCGEQLGRTLWDNDLIVPKITITFCKLSFHFHKALSEVHLCHLIGAFIGCDLRTHISHLKNSSNI